MHSFYWFWKFEFWYYLVLALILLTEWLWVTLKVCRTTRSVFALTLLSFTLLLATALIYFAKFDTIWYSNWVSLIFKCFTASVTVQSWLFAMQYLQSYLYTCKGGESIAYKIHTVVKFAVIFFYAAAIIYFKWR